MNYFQELDCKDYNSINKEILQYIEQLGLVDRTEVFWNPLNTSAMLKSTPSFLNWTNKHNLKLYSVVLTVARNEYPVRIHTDTPPARFKLSWPILNTSNSFNRWFKVISLHPKTEINSLGGTVYTDIRDLQEICRRRVDFPAIIDAGIPHDVIFEGDVVYPRLGLQCQLFKEPTTL